MKALHIIAAAALVLGASGFASAQKGHAYGKSKHDTDWTSHTRRTTHGSTISELAKHHGRITTTRHHGKFDDDDTTRRHHGRVESMRRHGEPTWHTTTVRRPTAPTGYRWKSRR